MLPTSLITSLLLLLSLTSAATGPRRQKRCKSSSSQTSFLVVPPPTHQNTSTSVGTGNTDTGTAGTWNTNSGTGNTNAGTSSTTSNMNDTTTADGSSLVVSMTRYGYGDMMGSQNCAVSAGACGPTGMGGFTAAISENLFGSPSTGAPGPACGECWSLKANGGTAVTVKVDNLCPRQGNSMCAQQTTADVNQVGGHANFDLCSDSGAADAVMGKGVGEAMGTAVKLTSC